MINMASPPPVQQTTLNVQQMSPDQLQQLFQQMQTMWSTPGTAAVVSSPPGVPQQATSFTVSSMNPVTTIPQSQPLLLNNGVPLATMQQQQQLEAMCVQRHPKDAMKAWSKVVPLSSLAPNDTISKDARDKALQAWKDENAFSGLSRRKREEGALRPLDASIHHPASIKEAFTADALLKEIPDKKTADERACVRPYGFSAQDKKNPNFKSAWGGKDQDCGFLRVCYSVDDETGELVNAEDRAKKVHKQLGGIQVARGYCLARADALQANAQNKLQNTPQAQKQEDRVTQLERALTLAQNPSWTDDQCR